MLKKIKANLPKLVALLCLSVFAAYFWFNQEDFKPLTQINSLAVFTVVCLNIALVAMNGMFITVILKSYKKDIPILESFYVSLFSSVTNFFAPAGTGFGLRAIYLKKRYQLSYQDFVSTLSGNYVVVIILNSLFALLTLFTLRENHSSQYKLLVLFFLSVFVFFTVLIFLKPSKINNFKTHNRILSRVLKILEKVIIGWRQLIEDKILLLKLTAIILCNFFISLQIVTIEVQSLGIQMGLQELILFTVLSNLSLFISITPANIGVKEAIYVFSATVLGLSVSQVLLIQLVDRGIIFITFLILWVLTTKLRRRINSAVLNAIVF